MYVIIDAETGVAITLGIIPEEFPELAADRKILEAPDDTIFGDTYKDGEWLKTGVVPEPPLPPEPSDIEAKVAKLTEEMEDMDAALTTILEVYSDVE